MKTVLLDLDGTLLPMDQDEFVNGYFGFLVKKMVPYGYEAQKLIKTVWIGTEAMVKNDGSCTNEEAFWRVVASVYGEDVRRDIPLFMEFYEKEFQEAKTFCGFAPKAAEVIAFLRENGVRAALATNPLFPTVATNSRIRWAGLDPSDFALVTTYENIGCCKPNPAYYSEILRRLDAAPQDCLMVGNDVGEDMVAKTLGIDVFLLTDCLINRGGEDISVYPHGGFDDLIAYLRKTVL